MVVEDHRDDVDSESSGSGELLRTVQEAAVATQRDDLSVRICDLGAERGRKRVAQGSEVI